MSMDAANDLVVRHFRRLGTMISSACDDTHTVEHCLRTICHVRDGIPSDRLPEMVQSYEENFPRFFRLFFPNAILSNISHDQKVAARVGALDLYCEGAIHNYFEGCVHELKNIFGF